MAARFAASPFAHNGPVALALSPSLCFALAVSGGAGQSCAAVGCALAYCCDLLRAPEATLGIVWCTVVALYLCLLLGGGAGGAGCGAGWGWATGSGTGLTGAETGSRTTASRITGSRITGSFKVGGAVLMSAGADGKAPTA